MRPRSSVVRSTCCLSGHSRARQAALIDRSRRCRRCPRKKNATIDQRRRRTRNASVGRTPWRPRQREPLRIKHSDDGPSRQSYGARYGDAIRDVAATWTVEDVAAARPATSNSTTELPSPWADLLRPRTSSCAARRTTSIRRTSTSAAHSWMRGAAISPMREHSPGNVEGWRPRREDVVDVRILSMWTVLVAIAHANSSGVRGAVERVVAGSEVVIPPGAARPLSSGTGAADLLLCLEWPKRAGMCQTTPGIGSTASNPGNHSDFRREHR